MKCRLMTSLLVFVLVGHTAMAQEAAVSIFELQYTAASDGQSPYDGQIVNCLGGIVTHKVSSPPLSKPRIILQDPVVRNADIQGVNCCWGAIQVKDWFYTTFNNVNIGDWIEFTNVTVEDSQGTTFLQYWNSNPMPSFSVISSDHPVPEPLVVDVNAITSPLLPDPYNSQYFYLENHDAEKYESMWIKVRNISIIDKDLGKAGDNYVLQSSVAPNDPNFSCWAADYMNIDAIGDYHPYVEMDQHFCSVEGIFEQYTNISEGLGDYYQLITTETEDFLLIQPGDLDDDCDVDFSDFSEFAGYWLVSCSVDPNVCGRADLIEDNVVDQNDLNEFVFHWLEGMQ